VDGDKSSIMVMEPPSPQCVGREFVRQYYTLLNQAPLHLHRFYSHNSSFVHGGLDNTGKDAQDAEAAAVYGQQEIHQKIMQLNFRDCHAKIRQVDSHETLSNGVVVQVSGELSNNGEPMRRFMQTFVLAPQSPKKYYVHNDIFRYQDEVFTEGDETTGTNSSLPNIEADLEPSQLKAQIIAQQVDSGPIKPVVMEAKINMEPPQHLNGSNNTTVGFEPVQQQEMEVEETIGEWKEPEPVAQFQQSPAQSAPVVEPVQAQVWKSPESEPEPAVMPVEDLEDPAEEVPTAPVSNEPRTWASMAKQGAGTIAASKPPAAPGNSGTTPRSGDSKEGTPFSQGKPFRGQRAGSQGRSAAAPSTPGSAGPPTARPERFSKEDDGPRNRILSTSDSQQLFVGNLPHNCSDDDLMELFGKFGKVVDVRINQKSGRENAQARGGKAPAFVPNFGFIVFEHADAVERALGARPILLNGSHRLNVEEKKMRVPREPGQYQDRRQEDRGNRGSQDNLRGAGHPGGRGGGDRGRGDRGGGRGGGRGRGDYGGPRGGGRGGPPGEVRGGGYRGGGRGS